MVRMRSLALLLALLAPAAPAVVLAAAAPAAADVPAGPVCRAQVIPFSPGFTAVVTIDNNAGTAPVNGWTIGFDLPQRAAVTMVFGSSLARAGDHGTLTPLAWSATVLPGHQMFVGFGGTATPFTPPSSFTLNGSPCVSSGGW